MLSKSPRSMRQRAPFSYLPSPSSTAPDIIRLNVIGCAFGASGGVSAAAPASNGALFPSPSRSSTSPPFFVEAPGAAKALEEAPRPRTRSKTPFLSPLGLRASLPPRPPSRASEFPPPIPLPDVDGAVLFAAALAPSLDRARANGLLLPPALRETSWPEEAAAAAVAMLSLLLPAFSSGFLTMSSPALVQVPLYVKMPGWRRLFARRGRARVSTWLASSHPPVVTGHMSQRSGRE